MFHPRSTLSFVLAVAACLWLASLVAPRPAAAAIYDPPPAPQVPLVGGGTPSGGPDCPIGSTYSYRECPPPIHCFDEREEPATRRDSAHQPSHEDRSTARAPFSQGSGGNLPEQCTRPPERTLPLALPGLPSTGTPCGGSLKLGLLFTPAQCDPDPTVPPDPPQWLTEVYVGDGFILDLTQCMSEQEYSLLGGLYLLDPAPGTYELVVGCCSGGCE
jgi:hypothetical protein